MRKQKINGRFILRKLKIIFLFLISTCALIFNSGCQMVGVSHDMQIPENIRSGHAAELLKNKTKPKAFGQFKNDRQFANYIKSYLAQVNPNLKSDAFIKTIFTESKKFGYDPVFLIAVIKTESQFNEKAVGSAGEIGLMQIKPDTAKWICQKSGLVWRGAEALKDPAYNVKVSAVYFKYLRGTLKAKSDKYINAYNLGPNKLNRLPAQYVMEHPYYHKVIKNYFEVYEELMRIKNDNSNIAAI